MSRLSRFTQLIFGSTAGNNQIAEYGSLAASSPATYNGSTITPAIIQTLSNYLEGWFGAVIGQNSPAIEDMNALCYLYAFQLAYIFQAGIPEWDSGTIYYTGSLVQSAGVWYVSIIDTNLNHAVTDSTKWFTPTQPGVLSQNALPFSSGMTLPANESMMWPHLQIGNGQTFVVPNNANLIGVSAIVISGTGVLQATGSGVIRVI